MWEPPQMIHHKVNTCDIYWPIFLFFGVCGSWFWQVGRGGGCWMCLQFKVYMWHYNGSPWEVVCFLGGALTMGTITHDPSQRDYNMYWPSFLVREFMGCGFDWWAGVRIVPHVLLFRVSLRNYDGPLFESSAILGWQSILGNHHPSVHLQYISTICRLWL